MRRTVLGGMVALGLAPRAGAAERARGGAAALVATRDGLADLVLEGERGAVIDPAQRWHLGSNTKAMTAALYARLVDQGRCRRDATVASLFPTIAAHPAWAAIGVDEVMAHAAGITDATIDAAWLRARHADRLPPAAQRRRFVAGLLAAPPAGQRGRYHYANANYVLLGAAIEEATGVDWQTAIRDELFAPLAMRDIGFGAPPRDGLWGREKVAGVLRPVDPAGIADNPAVLWPSGGVHLTAADYARFLALWLSDGAPLLAPATLGWLLAPPQPGGRYAGGWLLDGPTEAPAEMLAHTGSNTLWFATALVDRAAGRGYAAMTNRGDAEGERVTAALIDRVRGAAIAAPSS